MRIKNTLIALTTIGLLAFGARAMADTTAYEFDPVHSSVGFKVKHMVVTNVHGSFDSFEGKIHLHPDDITKSSVEVTIQAASINTKNEKRDDHLRSPDFLAVEQFPTITFKSKKIKKSDNGFVAVGDLTIRDVTKTVEIPFEFAGPITNPWGQQVVGATAELKINRMDYGAKWNKAIEAGGVVVDETVKIELNVEASKSQS